MKKLISIIALIFTTVNTWAQAPEKMSYQAIIRDVSNNLVSSQAVGIQISILQGNITGTPVYVETHTPTTNSNGMVSLEIGTGTVVSGNFSTIDWANDIYFLKTETDPLGGTTYTITGTSQLLSVPYALHAKSAATLTGTITESQISDLTHTVDTDTHIDSIGIANLGFVAGSQNNFYLGQDTLGGIVFYIYRDSVGEEHGLIVNKNESNAIWSTTSTVTNADRTWDGVYNTGLMGNSPAAIYVNGLTDGGFNDWYLPSVDELYLLGNNRYHVNNALSNAASSQLLSLGENYWSSTEWSSNLAMGVGFLTLYTIQGVKTSSNYKVRAIRAF